MKLSNLLKNKIFLFTMVFVVTFGIGAGLASLYTHFFDGSIETKSAKGKTINVLIMGIDARKGEVNARSDTMILASLNTEMKKVALIWIPRDTRVETSKGKSDRINSVNYLKGPEAACSEVGKLIGTKVNYYVVVNFSGFEQIINTLGGVHIDVETNMYHPDPDPKLSINIKKGYQQLDGKQALDYVRFRGGPTADIGRTHRQQHFIKALADEMFAAKTVLKLPKLIPQLADMVHTNIPISDMLFLANVANKFSHNDLITQTLPGYPYSDPRTGASYWEADKNIAKNIIDKLLNGESFEVSQDPPNWNNISRPSPLPVLQEPILEEEINEPEEIDLPLEPENNIEVEEPIIPIEIIPEPNWEEQINNNLPIEP